MEKKNNDFESNFGISDDKRRNFFMIDNVFFDKMLKLVGTPGLVVYVALNRFADKDMKCYPSLKLIAKQAGVGKTTVKRGVSELKKRNIIKVEKKRASKGKWLNNLYRLIDESEWNYDEINQKQDTTMNISKDQGRNTALDKKSIKQSKTNEGRNTALDKDNSSNEGRNTTVVQGPNTTTNNTNRCKKTHIESLRTSPEILRISEKALHDSGRDRPSENEGASSDKDSEQEKQIKELANLVRNKKDVSGEDIKKVFEVFYKGNNPHVNFANKTLRNHAEKLIKKFGLNGTINVAKFAVSVHGLPYAPTITDPLELFNKLSKLEAYLLREKNQEKSTIGNIEDIFN